MPTAAASNDHQRVLVTRWWFPRLPCALHRLHLTTTTYAQPLPPLTTTNESSRLVGGFLGFHVPSTATNESRRLVGGFLGFHVPTTATNESQRLVGGFLGFNSAAKSLSWTPEG